MQFHLIQHMPQAAPKNHYSGTMLECLAHLNGMMEGLPVEWRTVKAAMNLGFRIERSI